MSEFVWQQPSLADPADLQRELDMCDAMSWPQWIWAQVGEIFVACGVNEKAEQESEQRRLSNGLLGGWSAWVANQCCAEQGQLHRRGVRGTVASIWLHGLHTPWDAVAAVWSLAWHLGTQLLFCRSCLMHVVCVATGALHLWTQLLLGGAVRCNRMQL